jgi:hypothetical protein
MSKTFTTVAAILLLLIAACHIARAVLGIPVMVDHIDIPVWASWVAAGVTAVLGVMVFAEMRN